MKEFRLKEMILLSMKERKSRRITFDPMRTVMIGGNETGKSVLLKSIYWTLGAEPHKMHSRWLGAHPLSLVSFSLDSEEFYMIRQQKTFGLFDHNKRLIGAYHRISDLGYKLADLFGFKLELPDREGKAVIPPPAYQFLPFYMDQDNSWQKNWESFTGLYLPSARTDVVHYHTGIRPNQYYTVKNELNVLNDSINDIQKEIRLIRTLLSSLKAKFVEANFSIDLETFQEEITEMLVSCEQLKQQQEKYKTKLSALYNTKISLEAQQTIVRKALTETQKDYHYAVDTLDAVVSCPSCGAEYENSFAERFGIAQDEQRCLELLSELDLELQKVLIDIEKLDIAFLANNAELSRIEFQLEKKRGEIKLKDIIESEGKREVQALFKEEIGKYDLELASKIELRQDLDTQLRELENKHRAGQIRLKFRNLLRAYLDLLNLKGVDTKAFARIDAKGSESGSKTPRELMAYYYAILHLMREYASSTYFPIVIDSPNQQGQDAENLPILLNFILNKQPKDSQLILSIEEEHGIDFNGKLIYLTNKQSVLSEDGYDEDFAAVRPFYNDIFGIKLFY